MSNYRRIACLSTEAVETLYALGAEELVAGISGFTVRPARARAEKPKISGFSSSRIERILAVEPDLVIGFSNMQADICRELAAAGVEVHLFNQRDLAGILRMVRVVAALVDRVETGERLVVELQSHIDAVARKASVHAKRPKVYFEEWNEPLISGIGWVSEMIAIAGGEDVFADLAAHSSAKQRIIADANEVVRRAPDIIIGSWCGKKFRAETVCTRDGWNAIPAVRNGMVVEIKSADILSPGPSAITEGLTQLADLIGRWHQEQT
ncbi:ABC transporter substrate-binding protein [Noviherbaspirillum saxi]|uniref:Cobalamin-binding protein n=1 Tax=Noviherbaspirillum saxi TaxID=2320863 RepID=A0A3A3FPI9_9BURK|nr:ABC transporter substrate-binding protein [Noviherbaspirillum saxi]RJF98102.1 cobalamin-binding protein [Noviherbaspirillum saxi]